MRGERARPRESRNDDIVFSGDDWFLGGLLRDKSNLIASSLHTLGIHEKLCARLIIDITALLSDLGSFPLQGIIDTNLHTLYK